MTLPVAITNPSLSLLPWHLPVWQLLHQAREQKRLGHALLLTGSVGVGVDQFAALLAQTLLCCNPGLEGLPCASCQPCYWVSAASHPDLLLIEPEDKSHVIKVDAIREAIDFVHHTSSQRQRRVVLIRGAAKMNRHAANALLKILEEPTPDTVFIVVAEQYLALPATIRSRCQHFALKPPTTDLALAWLREQPEVFDHPQLDLLLNLAYGAPLQVIQYITMDFMIKRQQFYQDLLRLLSSGTGRMTIIAGWYEEDWQQAIDWLLCWLRDFYCALLVGEEAVLINRDFAETIYKIAHQYSCQALFAYQRELLQLRQLSEAQATLNASIVWDKLLLGWAELSCN